MSQAMMSMMSSGASLPSTIYVSCFIPTTLNKLIEAMLSNSQATFARLHRPLPAKLDLPYAYRHGSLGQVSPIVEAEFSDFLVLSFDEFYCQHVNSATFIVGKTGINPYRTCVLASRLPELCQTYGRINTLPIDVNEREILFVCDELVVQFKEALKTAETWLTGYLSILARTMAPLDQYEWLFELRIVRPYVEQVACAFDPSVHFTGDRA
ncbi:hypothetical protein EK21DRAFT_90155 [Setomelanomma holmii]|uniref:Uncharacterized protein n=1 Tax=Setomelanomma holmii TaxID=210430 RepID=A0A9P4LLR9_9PLEO|nr:hypothetical protein EK21DRAFT_90155 [Setomelanomma holmii]